MMRRIVVIAPLVLLLDVIAPSVWGDPVAPSQFQSPIGRERRSAFVGDAGQIYDACNDGNGSATLRNRVIEVTGMISRISVSPPGVDLEDRDRWFGGVVTCDFAGDPNQALTKMADGETVTARGILTSCGSHTTLAPCVISHQQRP